MKELLQTKLCKLTAVLVTALSPVSPQVYGQLLSIPCNTVAENVLPVSHILCSPYRDLNPFNNLPGELNQWGIGTVYLNNGDSVDGRFLVYNSLGSNLLLVKYGTETVLLVDKSTVKKFTFRSEKTKNETFTYEFFPLSGWYYSDGNGAFLEVLVKDTISLYYLNTIEKFPMSDNLKGHHYFFVQKTVGEIKRIRTGRKNICNTLECSDEFRKHLRGMHLHGRKRARMILAVKEYNRFIKAY
jgi:hypothetical protein